MVDTPPSSEPTTSTVVDVSHAQTETMTEEERKALIAKHRELANAIADVQHGFPAPEGLDEMDAEEESRVMKEFSRKRHIAATPALTEYKEWRKQLKPHEIRAVWPTRTRTDEEYQKFLDKIPEGWY